MVMTVFQQKTGFTECDQQNSPRQISLDSSKRSHEAPMTFNMVIGNGVSMPKVQEPFTMLVHVTE